MCSASEAANIYNPFRYLKSGRMQIFFLLALAAFTSRFSIVKTSYLDVPRIHFKGKYRADVNSRNNCQCNFNESNPLNEIQEWNYKGSGEFQFIDTSITSVIDKNGKEDSDSPLLHGGIFSNDKAPLAKLVDLDVDFQIPALHGLKFGIEVDGEIILRGDWSVATVVRDQWERLKCDKSMVTHSTTGTLTTSRITNIEWLSEKAKPLQDATKCEKCTGDLAVSISFSYYSAVVFTMGNVIGTIGIAKEGEPLNVGGDRKLESTNPDITLLCPDEGEEADGPFTNVAPFIYDENRNTVVLDISNAFPMDADDNPLDIGKLWLGVFVTEPQPDFFSQIFSAMGLSSFNDGILIFGEPIPYKDAKTRDRGGIVEYAIPSDLKPTIESSLLVIVKEVHSDSSAEEIYPLRELLPSLQSENNKGQILLKELTYFIRPTGYYYDKLEYSNANCDTSSITLFVTSFGKPAEGVVVKIEEVKSVFPEDGMIVVETSKLTNADGLVTFTFKVNVPIPYPRKYQDGNPCDPYYCPPSKMERLKISRTQNQTNTTYEFPIDGQLYQFCYYVADGSTSGCKHEYNETNVNQVIAFVAYSTMNYKKPYTWVDHVGPIFTQVHHLHYVMRAILDLSSYIVVTEPHNINLLQMSLSQDINNAGYMPVTRDLSPTKMNMILDWLENPCYSDVDCNIQNICPHQSSATRIMTESEYERCGRSIIPTESNPERYFREIFHDEYSSFAYRAENPLRPLFGYGSEEELENVFMGAKVEPFFPLCTRESLQQQLQLAVQVEFCTIPLYATSLYTIVENCNIQAQHLIKNIIIQEMLHFAQAANILIAIGGNVIIDSKDIVPQYPLYPLPGGILPNLTLTLEKYTMKHVHDNFMALEVPMKTTVPMPHEQWNTIGQFYKEIQICMIALGDEIFDDPHELKQVEWPWSSPVAVGTLYKVTDLESAIRGLEQIVEQGEGTSADNPVDESTHQYAHFFRFEEIFCENRLKKSPEGNSYSYSGAPIPYNANGVWNMKDNLKVADIKINTTCHTEARAFHDVYRSFLRVLQRTFNGHPREINKAVKLMESLKLHAKKTLWTPLDDTSQETADEQTMCGPIWDYEWE